MTDSELDAIEGHLGDACYCTDGETPACVSCKAVEAIDALRRELAEVKADRSRCWECDPGSAYEILCETHKAEVNALTDSMKPRIREIIDAARNTKGDE